MIAYHITGRTLRDGRPLPAVGDVLRHDGPVVPCRSGLHASMRLFEALQHAPDDACWLHRVEVGGKLVERADKISASERTILESWPLRVEDLCVLAGECAALACWSAGLTREAHQRAATATTAYRLGECELDVLRERWFDAACDAEIATTAATAAWNATAARGVGDAAGIAWFVARAVRNAAWAAAWAAAGGRDAVWSAKVADWAAWGACEARAVEMLTGSVRSKP